jgi:uncharacterized protein (TIGR02246 family)
MPRTPKERIVWDMTTHPETESHPDGEGAAADDGVHEFLELFAGAWNNNDGATVARFFSEDGSLINPFGQHAVGRAAVATMYTEYFGGMLRGTTTTFNHLSVRGIEVGHAFIDSEQLITASTGEIVLVAHVAALLRRHGDSWLFVDARPYTFPAIPA